MSEFIFMTFESISWPAALTIGFFLLFLHGTVLTPPSELSLAALGLYATLHQWLFLPAVLTATAGNLLGCALLFTLSRRYSNQITGFIMSSRLKYIKHLTNKAKTEFYQRGHLFVLYGRCIPNIRSAISIPAGFSNMSLSTFLIYSAIGCLIWALLWVSVGFFIGHHLLVIIETHKSISVIILVLIVLAALAHRYYFLRTEKL